MRSTKPAPQPLDLSKSLVNSRVRPEPFDYAQESLVEACPELVEWGGR